MDMSLCNGRTLVIPVSDSGTFFFLTSYALVLGCFQMTMYLTFHLLASCKLFYKTLKSKLLVNGVSFTTGKQ